MFRQLSEGAKEHILKWDGVKQSIIGNDHLNCTYCHHNSSIASGKRRELQGSDGMANTGGRVGMEEAVELSIATMGKNCYSWKGEGRRELEK